MIIQERLQAAFQQFGWVRILETLHSHAEEAAKLNLTYLEFLDKLLQEELAAKHDRYLRTRTRLAKLPYHKTIDQFDFEFQPSINERRIRDLATQVLFLCQNVAGKVCTFTPRHSAFSLCDKQTMSKESVQEVMLSENSKTSFNIQ